jgi:hypothetical protein
MVDWHRFTPLDFEYDFEQDKLAAHGVTFNEAVDCFFRTSRCAGTRNSKIAIN